MEEDTGHGSEPTVGQPPGRRRETGATSKTRGIEVDLVPRRAAEAEVATAALPSSSIRDSQEFKKISESILKLSQERERGNQFTGEETTPIIAGSNFIYMQNYANEPFGHPPAVRSRFVSSPTSGAKMGYLSAGGQRSPVLGTEDAQNVTQRLTTSQISSGRLGSQR